jgi:tetratricopeptide (TPR) repeat protein
MGKCYEKLKNTNEAIEQYRTALLYNPDYIEAKDALGRLGVK